MKIIISYSYFPYFTAVYIEKALKKKHEVSYFGPPLNLRKGYFSNADISEIINGESDYPDFFLFIEPAVKFFPRGLENLNCPTACYIVDPHQGIWVREEYTKFFDYIFITHKDYVQHFKSLGYKNVFWLPVACDPKIHGHRDLPKKYDIGFVGNVLLDPRRLKLLQILSSHFKLNDFTKFYPKEKIAEIYSQSKIVFNSCVNKDLNMRVFEALASGSMLLTERAENGLLDLFTNRKHLVTYENDGEIVDLASYYLKNEEERERIAEEGRKLVIKEHTYDHRVDFILKTVFAAKNPSLDARIRYMDPEDRIVSYAKIYSMLRLVDPLLDQFHIAWNKKKGRVKIAIILLKTLLKRINTFIPFTWKSIKHIRKMKKKTKLID